MVSTLTWVLAGIVVYTVAVMALRARGKLPRSVRIMGPLTTLRTKRGRAFLDWLATPKRAWRAWGNFGVGMFLVVMVGVFAGVLTSGLQALQQPERTPVQNPQNALVIPGVNEFLPLSAAPEIVFGLLVALVVHEGGHGLLCRVEDIDIDSMGLAFFAFVPIGAFVEPDEESRNEADRGSQVRMFAAGVANNFAVAFVAFLLLFGPVSGSIAVVSGVPVGSTAEGSASAAAGIDYGDVVTTVEGRPVENETELRAALDRAEGREVTVGLKEGGPKTVERRLLVTEAVPGAMPGIDFGRGKPTVVTAVNGTAVYTEAQFASAVEDRPVARIETNRGNATVPVGAYVASVSEDGALAAAGAPTDGTPVVITSVDGRRTANFSALDAALSRTDPGDTVPVVAYVDGERRTYQVELDGGPGREGGFLGVRVRFGYTGLVLDDFGLDAYPAAQFLGLLGGSAGPLGGLFEGTFLRLVFVSLVLPFFNVVVPGGVYNFAGFVPVVQNFYVPSGPLEFLGGGVFLLANLLFWTGWVNLNLGLFNAIPTFPLDGGHVFRAGVESIAVRLPTDSARRVTTTLTVAISGVMLVALLLMLFGPQLSP